MILSRTVAQPSTRRSATLRPCFRKRPSSCAITSGAQSVSGTNPTRSAPRGTTELTARDFLFIKRRNVSVARPLAARMPSRAGGTMNAFRISNRNHERDSSMTVPLDSRQIRAFCVLARTGSFTQAARELHLTQSGVSHSMKALERDIGCRLLDRLGKKVVLTQAGEQLLQHTTKILQEMENARESLAHLGKWGRGRLRLGASTTACQYLIPPVLREFKESFPAHTIMIEPGDTPELVALLLRHRIDLA